MEQLGLIGGFLPLIIVLVLMYFMMIRPQQKQQKKLSEMRSGLKVGDHVVTIGGIKGKITKVGEDFVTIRSGNGAQLDLVKTAIGTTSETHEPKRVEEDRETEVIESDNTQE